MNHEIIAEIRDLSVVYHTEEDDVPWETGTVIDVRMPQERAANVHTEVVEGQKCLVIPLSGDESARINGVEVE